ncbi:very short patch repair endonuclease [Geoalkalibacter halelectricus]|uniref:Very short patch repair endonuclease n=2 Tax=Geoalkalibacter halelectricus TaxID=2847045 RepID=A0ABY5ZJ78_9BACT|nr:very short patch repair endonuclease [Geoalkalibacter halelectricus]MDO3377311.1 very short patch repair endonuclease [Geoalkalibacter halelectricus]UWZ79183.1 very short patch repair endonuclease [Geoalkalibacter halelectricus]
MSRISGRDTKPEIAVRRILHAMGYRFRLHVRQIPGNPDIVLPRHRKVVFVHGCFWHGHAGCPRSKRPSTNVGFWNAKIDANMARDERAVRGLVGDGWRVLVIWECETRMQDQLIEKLSEFMRDKENN